MKKSTEEQKKLNKLSFTELFFTEGGFSLMILFPGVVIYFLLKAIINI